MTKSYKHKSSFVYEGKRYYVRADSPEEIAIKKYEKLKQLKENALIVTGDMPLEKWTMRCIDVYKTNLNPTTKRKYINRVKHCVLDHIGQLPLKKITPTNCQEVMNLQKGNSNTQIKEVYNALKFIFKMAKANKLIAYDPTENLVRPKGYTNRRRALTPFERKSVIDLASTDRRWYIYLLMIYCGCRPSEAANAMGKDITKIDGVNVLHIRGTKTEYADRFVPIPPDLYSLIKNTPKFEYISVTKNGDPITNMSNLWKGFKYYLNIQMGCEVYRNKLIPPYKVAPDLVPYCFRHEYCTELARKGIDIRVAQRLMGHADISTTANIYTNLDTSHIVETARLLHFG